MFAKMLLWLFIGFSALLWLLTFGYLLILRGLAVFNRHVDHEKTNLPKIAVVIPTLNEEAGIIEDVYEPFLMSLGFLQRTPNGRIVTSAGYEYLNDDIFQPRT